MLTEKVELLGKGLYENIPDVLTLKSLPTASELEYVGSEDFDQTMLEKILPKAVEEDIDFKQLLEIDYQWILRCLRLLNYGPYHTTNAIYCGRSGCGDVSYGEYIVNLNSIECKMLPEGFVNDVVITSDQFIDFNGEVHVQLPTIQKILNSYKDKAFQTKDGRSIRELARMCYMISSIKGKSSLTPIEIKMTIQNEMSPADYAILQETVRELTDYGLRLGGKCQCPKCGNNDAAFVALVDDRFFRPTLGDLRKWKDDRRAGKAEDISGSETAAV